MVLRAGERVGLAGLRQFGAGGKILGCSCAEHVSVVADSMTDATRLDASVTERKTKRIIRLARLNPDRAFDLAIADADLDNITISDAMLFSSFATDEDGIVPDH